MKLRSKTLRFISFFMALLMFITSTGFVIDAHYCQGKLKRINLFGKAKTCQEVANCQKKCGAKVVKSCHLSSDASDLMHSDKGCCDNNSTFVKYDGDLPVTTFSSFPDLEIEAVLLLTFHFITLIIDQYNPKPLNSFFWPPPPFEKNFPVLFQRFLC